MSDMNVNRLARLKRIVAQSGVCDLWGAELSPEDATAILWVVATMERYLKALEQLRDTLGPATGPESIFVTTKAFRIIREALSPDPSAPAETEAQG